MKESLIKELNPGKESIHTQRVITMKVNGIMVKNMDVEFMYGYMIKKHKIKKFMMVNLNMT